MMNSRFYLLAAALVTLAACGNDNEMTDSATNNGELVPLQVTGSINAAKTRVTVDSQWEQNDKIGISGTSGNLTYTNYRYDYKSGTEFAPEAGKQIYFGAETGTFTAYYPHQSHKDIIKDGIITWSVNNTTADFLFAESVVSKEDPNLSLKFDHKMSMLILHMRGGEGFKDINFQNSFFDDKINFAPVKSQVLFNTTNGTVTPTGDPLVPFPPTSHVEPGEEYVYYYRIILCPETIEGGLTFSLQKKTGNKYVTCKALLTTNKDKANPEIVMEPGKVYEYTITVHKTEMIPSKVTISQWENAWEESKDVDATV